MSMKPKKIVFEDVWGNLKNTVNLLMTGTVPRNEWYNGYGDVYHLCVATPESLAERLYQATEEYLWQHASHLHEIVVEKCKMVGLLAAYHEQWTEYSRGTTYLNTLYLYLNIEHVRKKQTDDTGVYLGPWQASEGRLEIGQLGLDIWMKKMIEPQKEELIPLILQVVYEDRKQDTCHSDARYIKDIIDSFVAVEKFKQGASELSFYRKFEARYLEETYNYYSEISKSLVTSMTCSEYMEKVLGYIDQEEFRSRKFLDCSSYDAVIKECERVMVGEHLDFFYKQATVMVSELNEKDLRNMYTLLKPLESPALVPLVKDVQSRIEMIGSHLLQDLDTDNVAQSFVDAILKVHEDYHHLVSDVFKNDQLFATALDRACISVINTKHPKIGVKSPDLLARYCDQLLRKGNARPHEYFEIEAKLAKSITVFKYLDDKDHFQKSYSKLLAKRLIYGTSASLDLEESMINMLKQACGFEYTTKMHRMFSDTSTSTEMIQAFNQHLALQNASLDVGFTISILQAGTWPMPTSSLPSFTPPPILAKCIQTLEQFYQLKYSGRKLTWLHHLSNADVRLHFTKSPKPYVMTCSTFTVGVVSLFEQADALTYEELKRGTSLEDDYLSRVLQALVDVKLLIEKSSGKEAACSSTTESNYGPDTVFALNFDFSYKRLKFKITPAAVKEQIAQEQEQTAASLEDDRKAYLQALIVRLMKVRKVLKHKELVEQVFTHAAERFHADHTLIKKCIESLIEKQYIERMPNSTDEYSYMA